MSEGLNLDISYFTPKGEEILFIHSILFDKNKKVYKFMRVNGFVKVQITRVEHFYDISFFPETEVGEMNQLEINGIYIPYFKNIREMLCELSGNTFTFTTNLPDIINNNSFDN